MTDTPITVTLPLTQTGAFVLLTALGIAAATGLVYLTLYGQEAKPRPNPAMDWLTALGWAMVPVWFTLLGGTLWHLWLLFEGKDSFLSETGFGMGAVIAAFLGGPFVIWGTVIKQKTVEFQKESHITERISKAVEQLGEEKTVKEIIDGETVERTVPKYRGPHRRAALARTHRAGQHQLRQGPRPCAGDGDSLRLCAGECAKFCRDSFAKTSGDSANQNRRSNRLECDRSTFAKTSQL